jgi:hypothetical protein
MPRVIVVVARDRTDLFEYFGSVFAGMQDIKVILDRRLSESGGNAQYSPGDPGRRERLDIYDELQDRGFVIIRLW